MALLSKIDYFGLSGSGFEPQDTSENKQAGYIAEAQGPNGFLVAQDVGADIVAPSVTYVATQDVSIEDVKLGTVKTILGKKVALGGLTINTGAGQPVTCTATGQQVDDAGREGCTCTLSGVELEYRFHAQDFGLFTVSGGQLNQSTLNITPTIADARIDGVIKAWDLVGGSLRVSGTIIGVDDDGNISTPSITINDPSGNVGEGVITQPLTQTNPNGQYPTYSFEITYPLKADED